GLDQKIVVVNAASITLPLFHITGEIAPFTDDNGTPTNPNDDTTIPGLTVGAHGFALGTAELTFKPGGPGAGGRINFGNILEFDDLRVGIQHFAVDFRQPAAA